MKRIFLLCSCAVLAISHAEAQPAESDVNIGVVCPEQTDDLSTAGLARLRHKIEQIATANSVATYSDGTFVMYPVLDLFEVRTVESGMKNITVVKAEMVLSVVQISSGIRINSVSESGGSGSTAAVRSGTGRTGLLPGIAALLCESGSGDDRHLQTLPECTMRAVDPASQRVYSLERLLRSRCIPRRNRSRKSVQNRMFPDAGYYQAPS